MIALECAGCAKKLKVKDELAGKKVKCPACGQVIAVPAAQPVSSVGDQQTLPPQNPLRDQATIEQAKSHLKEASNPEATNPSLSKPDATVSPVPDDGSAALTDFLAPPEAPDELGRLGGFRILIILGHGGMGVVFLGEDTKLGRKVAIKAMLPHLAQSKTSIQRFLREARSAATLEHDHIVPILQVGEDRGAPFIVMPFLQGEPLDQRLTRESKLSYPEVLRIGREIAEALGFAHEAGLIHRDIKPANIWLEGTRGRVKILDFGLARTTSQDEGLTQQGAIIGTPSYMSPEQARGEAIDARSDLWALGVVLYRCATGNQPFKGADVVATLMSVATSEPPSPTSISQAVPGELSKLIMRLLEKDPARRYQSGAEVAQAIAEMDTSLATSAASGMRRPSVTSQTMEDQAGNSPRSPKKRWPWVASGFLVVALIAAAFFCLFGKEADLPIDNGPGAKFNDRKFPNPVAPAVRHGLQFDGKGSHVMIDSLRRTNNEPRTIEAFLIPATVSIENKSGAHVIGYRGTAGMMNIFQIKVVWKGHNVRALKYKSDASTITSAPGLVRPGVRTHVATTWDGVECRLFVDGKRVAAENTNANPQFFGTFNATILAASASTPIDRFWAGMMTEVRISKGIRYDKDFKPAERHVPDVDTLALYHFDDNQGDVLTDSLGNNHHGKIVGAKWVTLDGAPAAPQ